MKSFERQFRSYKTAEVIEAFAGYGVAIETISRALVVPATQVEAVCRRAQESGSLLAMPPRQASDTRTATMTELSNLRQKCDEQQQLIREMLKMNSAEALSWHSVCGLSGTEGAIIGALVDRGRVTKDRLYNIVYGMRPEQDQPEPKIIDVFICKIRRKLREYGVEIETLWGEGYIMTDENRQRMRELAGLAVPSPSIVPAVADMVAG